MRNWARKLTQILGLNTTRGTGGSDRLVSTSGSAEMGLMPAPWRRSRHVSGGASRLALLTLLVLAGGVGVASAAWLAGGGVAACYQ